MDLLLEIGTEELPAGWINTALGNLDRALGEAVLDARLLVWQGHDKAGAGPNIELYGTPRRLAAIVRGINERQNDLEERVEGPPAKAGAKAAAGFAKKLGLAESELTVEGERFVGIRRAAGKPALEVLAPLLERVVRTLPAKQKSMRWGDEDVAFPRPVRWLVALAGSEVVPFTYGGVRSGRTTRGHRFLGSGALELGSPTDYLAALSNAHVIASFADRRKATWDAVVAAAATAGFTPLPNEGLLDQVANLVEEPHGVLGRFEADYLALPPEVVRSEMQHHQRYFPLAEGGKLTNAFVAVANVPVADPALSRAGYERVLRARLSDARFFFDEDRKVLLEDRVDRLDRIVFQQELGSIGDKVRRVEALSQELALAFGVSAGDAKTAARLSKADLTTGMVGEFPELQGVMGRAYAAGRFSDAIAEAIEEHYAPRTAEGELPRGALGAVVGVADRLDTLVGIFGIGKEPSASADPFALRRAAIATIRILLAFKPQLSLEALVDKAIEQLHSKLTAQPGELRAKIVEFFGGRLRSLWAERAPADVVDAVLAAGFDNLPAADRRLEGLAALYRQPEFGAIAETFTRVANLMAQAREKRFAAAEAASYADVEEAALHDAFAAHLARVAAAAPDDYLARLRSLGQLQPSVARFFAEVMVMADDADVRARRLGLLAGIEQSFTPIADFRRIQTKRQ